MSYAEHIVTEENGHVCVDNSYSGDLAGGVPFTGDWQDTLNYNVIIIGITTSQASATDGLSVEWSSDGITKTQDDVFSLTAGASKVFTFSPANRYFRIVYTNGPTLTTMDVQSIFKKAGFKASSHRISDSIIGEDDAELVTNVNKAKSALTSNFENITSYREALNVNQAWVHRKIVNETFHQHTGTSTTPTTPITEGDITINFSSVAGFAIGSKIKITEGGIQEIGLMTITNIATLVVTVDRPIGEDYTTAAEIAEVTSNGLATEKQKNYLKDLGVEFNDSITKKEASDLIEQTKNC